MLVIGHGLIAFHVDCVEADQDTFRFHSKLIRSLIRIFTGDRLENSNGEAQNSPDSK